METPLRATVNGREYERRVEPRLLLSDFLRHELGLTGTHVGCEHGVCGACTVLLDGEPVRACLLFAVQASGHEVTTVEGLADVDPGIGDTEDIPGLLHPIQRAFRETHALQCGFCTPGILMTTVAFLDENPWPTREEIREALSGHLCRCTGYQNIVNGVARAAELLGEAAGRGPEAANAPARGSVATSSGSAAADSSASPAADSSASPAADASASPATDSSEASA